MCVWWGGWGGTWECLAASCMNPNISHTAKANAINNTKTCCMYIPYVYMHHIHLAPACIRHQKSTCVCENVVIFNHAPGRPWRVQRIPRLLGAACVCTGSAPRCFHAHPIQPKQQHHGCARAGTPRAVRIHSPSSTSEGARHHSFEPSTRSGRGPAWGPAGPHATLLLCLLDRAFRRPAGTRGGREGGRRGLRHARGKP